MATERVLVVAQAFKETLSAAEVASAIAAGVEDAGARPDVILGSDGGDGLLEAVAPRLVKTTRHAVSGPLGDPVEAVAGWLSEDEAVVESRLVCGLSLVPPGRRNPRRTTTRGVGELVLELSRLGARRVLIGLGGSATMDGGLGMARAFGWVPRGVSGEVLPDCGDSLAELEAIDGGEKPPVSLTGLVDVLNPLLGAEGAAVYASQKGASAEDTVRLMKGLERLVALLADRGARELAERPGAGAAGGLGFGILFFGSGELQPGARWVLDLARFDERLKGAAMVLVAEGAFDRTSLYGKLTGEVIGRARCAGVPMALLAPRAEFVPEGVVVESGGGRWDGQELRRRAAAAVSRGLSSP
ncbi:Glycerate 2-kinase [bacterium HR33]|nr:Glycerate 2-kinase [bacterium HR33]